MCFICTMLDKSFPSPKQLAKAYFETTLAGVDTKDHYKDVEAKMDEHIGNQKMNETEFAQYVEDFNEEYSRLKGIGWQE